MSKNDGNAEGFLKSALGMLEKAWEVVKKIFGAQSEEAAHVEMAKRAWESMYEYAARLEKDRKAAKGEPMGTEASDAKYSVRHDVDKIVPKKDFVEVDHKGLSGKLRNYFKGGFSSQKDDLYYTDFSVTETSISEPLVYEVNVGDFSRINIDVPEGTFENTESGYRLNMSKLEDIVRYAVRIADDMAQNGKSYYYFPNEGEYEFGKPSDKSEGTGADDAKYAIDKPTDVRNFSSEQRKERKEKLLGAKVTTIVPNSIQKTQDKSARKIAEEWMKTNHPNGKVYKTEVGEVVIDSRSIKESLAHKYSQEKLDAITSLFDGFENETYLGGLKDFSNRENTWSHFFAYPVEYNGEKGFVFCRAKQDNNLNRLYVHEVFYDDKLKTDSLQTAAVDDIVNRLHGGIGLYKSILIDALEYRGKGTNNSSTDQTNDAKLSLPSKTTDTRSEAQVKADVDKYFPEDKIELGGKYEKIGNADYKGSAYMKWNQLFNPLMNYVGRTDAEANPTPWNNKNGNVTDVRVTSKSNADRTPTIFDYYQDTEATFKPVVEEIEGESKIQRMRRIRDTWEEMKASDKYLHHKSPYKGSRSEYLVDRETGDVYRFSNHWGDVASCKWDLEGDKGNNDMEIGVCNIADFKDFTRDYHTFLSDSYSDGYLKALDKTIRNYEWVLNGGKELGDGVRERMQDALDSYYLLRENIVNERENGEVNKRDSQVYEQRPKYSLPSDEVERSDDNDARIKFKIGQRKKEMDADILSLLGYRNAIFQNNLSDGIEYDIRHGETPDMAMLFVSQKRASFFSGHSIIEERTNGLMHEMMSAVGEYKTAEEFANAVAGNVHDRMEYEISVRDYVDRQIKEKYGLRREEGAEESRMLAPLKEYYQAKKELAFVKENIEPHYSEYQDENGNWKPSVYEAVWDEAHKLKSTSEGFSSHIDFFNSLRKAHILIDAADERVKNDYSAFEGVNSLMWDGIRNEEEKIAPYPFEQRADGTFYFGGFPKFKVEKPEDEKKNKEHRTQLKSKSMDQAAQSSTLSGTKVAINFENRKQIEKNLSSLHEKCSVDKIEAESFLRSIRKAMTTDSEDNSGYNTQEINGKIYTLRVSDHYPDAEHFVKNGQNNATGITIIISLDNRGRFRANKKVNLTEYVFNGENLDIEKERRIVEAIQQWMDTGHADIDFADYIHKSPKELTKEELGRDKEYEAAVNSGDTEKVKQMQLKEAHRKNYNENSEYQGGSAFNGAAPSAHEYYSSHEESLEAWENEEYEGSWSIADEFVRGIEMGDLANRITERDYARGSIFQKESIRALRDALRKVQNGDENPTVRVYRSVPKGVKERSFRNGDWVTLSKSYAIDNALIHAGMKYSEKGMIGWGKKAYNIIEMDVPIEDIWWDGNDINEFGYDNGKEMVYSNTPNNAKLLEPTYDENGKLIPLSKRFDSKNKNIKFKIGAATNSLADENNVIRVSTPADKNLVAIHNIEAKRLSQAIKLGGFAMPSIAITKAELGHEDFGDISLLFAKETINPSDRRNVVWDRDAWSPTFPEVKKKLSEKALDALYKKLKELVPEDKRASRIDVDESNLYDTLRRWDWDAADAFANNAGMKQAYLASMGKNVRLPMREQTYSNHRNSLLKQIIDLERETGIDLSNSSVFFEADNNPKYKAVVERMKEIVLNDRIERNSARIAANPEIEQMFRENYEMSFSEFDNLAYAAKRMKRDMDNNGGKVPQVVDTRAAEELLNNKVSATNKKYREWVTDLFEGIVEKEGIRNERDIFTPSGNRRSFEQTHDAVTLHNVVAAMLRESERGGKGFFGSNIFGAAANKLGSISEIKSQSDRLQKLDNENEASLKKALTDELAEVGHHVTSEDIGDIFDFRQALTEAVAMSHDAKGIYKELHPYWKKFTMADAEQVEDIVNRVGQMAVDYFEAKPNRAVSLNEVKAAVVPKGTDKALVEQLKQAGIKVVTYDKNVEGARVKAVDKAATKQNIKFKVGDKDSPIFVSNAAEAVKGIKQEKAPAGQWLAMLEKAGGLKAGEDKWLGLRSWLGEQAVDALAGKRDKNITKDEILDYIAKNDIRIEEVKYGKMTDDTGFPDKEKIEEVARPFIEEYDALIKSGVHGFDAYDQMRKKYGDTDFLYAFKQSEDLNSIHLTEDEEGFYTEGAMKFVVKQAGYEPINSTRLEYTTKGLDNNKEIALVVPTIEPYNENDEVHFGDAGGGRAVAWVRFGETTSANADGTVAKVLVIDEIQSKRHQDGREKGYTDMTKKSIDARVAEIDKRVREITNIIGNLNDEAWKMFNNRDEVNAYLDNNEERKTLLEESESLQQERSNLMFEKWHPEAVPDAPFDKNWHELAMKRMLRYAAENGYDKVAWTTGAQQAERYGIGRVVNSIEIDPTAVNEHRGEPVKGVTLYMNNGETALYVDKNGTVVDYEGASLGFSPEGTPLSDIIGKELANKMLNATEFTKAEGKDLMIGGEGMKGFYDQMLPSFMNKYGKKWGVKVGEVELDLPNEGDRKMWSVDVNDAMKADVMKGQKKFKATVEDLKKAEDFVGEALKGNKRNKSFSIDLPAATVELIRKRTGIIYNSHNIDANGLLHAKNNHGVGGRKIDGSSIPLRDEDIMLAPYIMMAPDDIVSGPFDITGRTSIRFVKHLGNGAVVYVEKEQKNSPQDMDTITMWADMSDRVNNTSRRSPAEHVQNVISTIDAAKIRKDAELAIEKDEKNRPGEKSPGTGVDKEYNSAVESGDVEKQNELVKEAAKAKMPETKVVDENGEPRRMYHGSDKKRGEITEFEMNDGSMGKGAYFTSSYEEACEYVREKFGVTKDEMDDEACEPYIGEYFLNVTDEKQITHSRFNPNGDIEVIATSPEQIKSADPITYDDEGNVIPLSKRFDSKNKNIKFKVGGPEADASGTVATEEQLRARQPMGPKDILARHFANMENKVENARREEDMQRYTNLIVDDMKSTLDKLKQRHDAGQEYLFQRSVEGSKKNIERGMRRLAWKSAAAEASWRKSVQEEMERFVSNIITGMGGADQTTVREIMRNLSHTQRVKNMDDVRLIAHNIFDAVLRGRERKVKETIEGQLKLRGTGTSKNGGNAMKEVDERHQKTIEGLRKRIESKMETPELEREKEDLNKEISAIGKLPEEMNEAEKAKHNELERKINEIELYERYKEAVDAYDAELRGLYNDLSNAKTPSARAAIRESIIESQAAKVKAMNDFSVMLKEYTKEGRTGKHDFLEGKEMERQGIRYAVLSDLKGVKASPYNPGHGGFGAWSTLNGVMKALGRHSSSG